MSSTKEPPASGTYIKCSCGAWFQPIFEDQTTCWKCRKDARTKEWQSYRPKVLVVI